MPPSAARSRPGRDCDGAGEGAFDVAEEGGHGGIAADGGAVDLDERPGDLAAGFLEFIDAAGQERLARAGRTHEQRGRLGGDGDAFDLLDEGVEFGVPRVDRIELLSARMRES